MSCNEVELGFVEKIATWKLRSKFFRSKVGGKPSWLSLEKLPEASELKCSNCGKPRMFLLQVYAPIDGLDEGFHRAIFLFMCTNGKCALEAPEATFVAFRSQLSRRNVFYNYDPPVDIEEDSKVPSAEQYNQLCDLCGCPGTIACDRCERNTYCSNVHKTMDWEGGHKNICSIETDSKGKRRKRNKPFLLPEYELVTETEYVPEKEQEKSDSEKMQEYQNFLQSAKAHSCIQDVEFDDLETLVKKPDKIFNKFKKRVGLEPEQVLRYQRGGDPLWVSSEHMPKNTDIPNCTCGAKRIFEFQVMPQLLCHLSLDTIGESVDWGTVVVYTCANSCNLGYSSYATEFVWRQNFSDGVK